MKPSGNYVLDSYAVLAFLEQEPGSSAVRTILEYGQHHDERIWISLINLGECLYIIEREQGLKAAVRTIAALRQLPIAEAEATRDRTFAAAHIKARYRVSFADAFAIALAIEKRATIITGDPEFKQVESLVDVLWLTK